MRVPPLAFLWGCVTFKLEKRCRRVYTALLIGNAFPVISVEATEDGGLQVTQRRRVFRAFAETVRRRRLPPPTVTGETGLPMLLHRFSHRPGLLVGGVLATALVALSTLFCWRVDVVCLDNAHAVREADYVDVAAVAERLEDIGVGVGTFLPTLDVRSAEKRFLIGQDTVSWIALNRRGTVLCAEVRSTHAVSDEHSGYVKATGENTAVGTNLVANADGLVRYWVLENGTATVEHEQMVTEGTLLATGFYEAKDGDVLYRRASGKVFAETVRTLRAEIPFSVTEQTATGESETRYTFSFFGAEAVTLTVPNVTFLEIFRNFGKKTGFLPREYDTIIDEHSFATKDGCPLPLSWKKETRFYSTAAARTRSREECLSLANAAITAQRAEMTDAEILSSERRVVWEDDRLIVTEDVYCIDNIAEEAPYYLKTNPKTEES